MYRIDNMLFLFHSCSLLIQHWVVLSSLGRLETWALRPIHGDEETPERGTGGFPTVSVFWESGCLSMQVHFVKLKIARADLNPQIGNWRQTTPEKHFTFYFGVGSFFSLTCSVQVIHEGGTFFRAPKSMKSIGSLARQPSQKKGTFPPKKRKTPNKTGKHVGKPAVLNLRPSTVNIAAWYL